MSGDVDCWFVVGGILVDVSVLRGRWIEFWIRSAIFFPLLSVIDECHNAEWALKSPVMRVFGVLRSGLRHFSMF